MLGCFETRSGKTSCFLKRFEKANNDCFSNDNFWKKPFLKMIGFETVAFENGWKLPRFMILFCWVY